ncbi:MAG: glycosyltransferase [Anaerolineae bacterium]|nr:glycosyltransferase [Anaerolineae bacterium]
MAPKVSVVMPVYNAERFLQAAIDSILEQTLADFELILVDDVSQDGSLALMEQNAARDARIKLVRNPHNLGEAGARNAGLKAATGEYVAVQDADDLAAPERLAVQTAYLDAHPEVGALGSTAHRINSEGQIIGQWEAPQTHERIRAHLLFTSPICHTTMMARHRLLEQLGGYTTEIFTTDYDLWWRLSGISRLETLPQPLAYYRISDNPHRITSGQAPRQLQASQVMSLQIAQAITPPGTVDAEAYGRFFMSMRGQDQIQPGDMRRLQPLWDFLAADPHYRAVTRDRLFSTSEKILRSHPSEALYAARVLRRQFDLPMTQLARQYLYRARQRRS